MIPNTFYREVLPERALTDYVKRRWLYENTSGEAQHYTIVPDGFFDLVIRIIDGVPQQPMLVGIYTQPLHISIAPGTSVFGITCKPLAAEYIFGQKIGGIVNSFEDLHDPFWEMTEPVRSFEGTADLYSEKMLARLSEVPPPDPRKTTLFGLLAANDGKLQVKELAARVYWSYRQMARYFMQQFGLSLKAYANVLRCAASYKHIRNGAPGADLSFCDQSHFIHEIRKHTGEKPKTLHRNENGRFLQFSTLSAE